MIITLRTMIVIVATIVATGCDRVIVGEMQDEPIDISPPTRLDVNLWNGTLDGRTTRERCDDMGGLLGYEPRWGAVCWGVDY
jgi:hypothetical protein